MLVLFKEEVQRELPEDGGVEGIWKNVKEAPVKVAGKTVGITKGEKSKEKEMGWCNEEVQDMIKRKEMAYKE